MSDALIKSKEPCPNCLLMSKTVNYLQTRAGSPTHCAAGHQFMDREELNMLLAQAKQQYPGFYQGPAAPAKPDPAIIAQQDIVIGPEMKKAIEEIAGVPVTGAADLKGIIFAFIQDNKDKDNELRRLNATLATMKNRGGGKPGAIGAGQVAITIPEWAIEGLAAQAEYSNMTPDEWIANEFNAWMENYFGAPAGGGMQR